MATKFLESGSDADFQVKAGTGFWDSLVAGTAPTSATDFVHGGHQRSIGYAINTTAGVNTAAGSVADAGARISFYLYINAYPSGGDSRFLTLYKSDGSTIVATVTLSTVGQLKMWRDNVGIQIGTTGSTLSKNTWYRISLAYTITSLTVNRFELRVDAVSSNSITNATLLNTGSSLLSLGNGSGDPNLDIRTSDHYIDDSSALTDTGNIWVTAKRPNANGTTNGFTTQIGAGGSGYGTGHSPQINERPLSNTNGWSMVGAGSAVTEEYNIESASTGDINISTATIVDYLGWVDSKAALSETASIIVNNVTSNISLTSTETLFTKIAGSTTYPAGTGTDIGLITATTVTTVSLYECGIVVAYIPAAAAATSNLTLLGVG